MVTERDLIEKAITGAGPAILNWPPSRGPQPEWMRKKPIYKIPQVVIEILSQKVKPLACKGGLILSLNHNVARMASLKPEQWELISGEAGGSLQNHLTDGDKARSLTVDLSYPLGHVARVTIQPYHFQPAGRGKVFHVRMDVGYVLWQLAKAYQTIYKSHKKWGVWGHAITDLYFEQLTIQGGRGNVDIGS